jgi:hypothetical protein
LNREHLYNDPDNIKLMAVTRLNAEKAIKNRTS